MPGNIDTSYILKREHPFYTSKKDTWRKCHDAYSGGGSYVQFALIRHISEILEEYNERLKRAYYFNYPRRIARIITQYVLSTRPERKGALPELVEDWSRTGLRTDEVMRQFSTMLNVYGVAWLAVDMPSFDGYKTKADEIAEKLRPYAIAISPLDVPDWCYGGNGELLWVITEEKTQDRSDPTVLPVDIRIRKLWTRQDVTVIAEYSTGKRTVQIIEHGLGIVPFVRMTESDGYGIDCNHWFEDVVRISDAILNNESEAQMNIIKQMFGLLVVSDSFAANTQQKSEVDSAGLSTTAIIARSAAIIESPEDKGISRYISPSGTDNATIRAENVQLIRQMFESIGLAVSKDTRMVESAEAKMWDFQNVEQLLCTRADMMEQAELWCWEFMHRWMPTIPVPTISYNRSFSMLDLKESIAALMELAGFNGESETYQQEVGRTAVCLLNRLRQMSQGKQEEISTQIDTMESAIAKATSIPSFGGDVDIS